MTDGIAIRGLEPGVGLHSCMDGETEMSQGRAEVHTDTIEIVLTAANLVGLRQNSQ